MQLGAAAEASADAGGEPTPWRPNGVTPKAAPAAERQATEDLRWRPARGSPGPLEDPQARSWQAVLGQCGNARVPGYTGFIPSAKAEDVYGRTQAGVGERSALEQAKRRGPPRASSCPGGAEAAPAARPASTAAPGAPAHPDDHPLGRSRAEMTRQHWVPTIPGYAGYVPAKHPENICGGGVVDTCRMAGRAIAARGRRPAADAAPDAPSREVALASSLREHCDRLIPGYGGHVPRVHGDSICGARARAVNALAADLAEDRIFNREAHDRAVCAPQGPPPRRLRL